MTILLYHHSIALGHKEMNKKYYKMKIMKISDTVCVKSLNQRKLL